MRIPPKSFPSGNKTVSHGLTSQKNRSIGIGVTDFTNIGVDGSKLRKAREKSGLTQSQVGKAVGIGKAAISKIENGGKSPSSDVLVRLCKLYGVQIENITCRSVRAA